MAIKSYFVIETNSLPVLKRFDHYPSDEEIEEQIKLRFPKGYIYDQFADENIYPAAKVNKYYTLSQEEEEE